MVVLLATRHPLPWDGAKFILVLAMWPLDDLAGLDNEELVEFLGQHGLSDYGEAGDIIMAARAHWFTDENADSTDTDNASASSDS